uniref:Uncharacterized protein n=1 Tax=Gossypium raimondii TaxID=29730 RepID=A0A0D2RWH4_GOSRA|nr:hypothetical protein B456_009G081800 [Gossypium raimondii]
MELFSNNRRTETMSYNFNLWFTLSYFWFIYSFLLLTSIRHANDGKNVKPLYRRGQAYKELGQLEDAISDLSRAHEVYPGDETVADVLRDAEERLAREGSHQAPQGVAIEEITEEAASTSSANRQTSFTKYSSKQPRETNSVCLEALKNDPEALRSFQKFISNADPYTLSALSSGKVGEVSPDLFKTATNMIATKNGSIGFGPGSVHPNVTPDMLKSATDMMTKMPPEELQKMFEAAASLEGNDSISTSTAVKSSRLDSDAENFRRHLSPMGIMVLVKPVLLVVFRIQCSQSNLPTSTADLQEQMRNQMKDPAMRQMFASMMKNMSPDIMENMGEQFGLKLSREDAKAQQAMASLSPEELDRKMRWADRIQKGVEGAKKAKNWLLGKSGFSL